MNNIEEAMRPFEVKAMIDVVVKEAEILTARANVISELARKERAPLKVIELNAEISMILRLIDTLADISDDTVNEAKRIGIKK